jgi:fused signal recognition particle receptor
MDGTGKGGFLVSYAAREKNPLPVVYMGYGEEIEDLKPFSAEEYIDRMLSE